MPPDAQIEVYNHGSLITHRFIPVDNASLLENLRSAHDDDERQKTIDDYLTSYQQLGKKPSLTCAELGETEHEFPFTEGKLMALRKLNAAISDRQNLESMIENEFTYFDQNEARQVVDFR